VDRPPSPRAQNLAVLLPLLGLFLLMPPFVTLFAGGARPWGVPLIVAYVFGAWAALLVAAGLLARRLLPKDPAEPPPSEAGIADAGDAPPA